MKLKKFSQWLVSESVNLELKKEYHNGEEGKLFLRWVHFFLRHLNHKEKPILKKLIKNIETNIEGMYDRIVWEDIKKALKEMNGNGSTS